MALSLSSTAFIMFVAERRDHDRIYHVLCKDQSRTYTVCRPISTIGMRKTSEILPDAYRLANPNANRRGSNGISFPSRDKNFSGMNEWESGYMSRSRLIALVHSGFRLDYVNSERWSLTTGQQ